MTDYITVLRNHYQSQPAEVSLETLALCNARCTFCPYPTLERQGVKMPDELIYRLIDEMSKWQIPFYFSPFKVNEPLLDSRLMDICRQVNERIPIAVLRLFTNGSALTDKHVESIAGLKRVYHLWISLNSHIPEEYEEVMGLNFEQTARKLDNLHSKDFPHKVVVSRVGIDNEFMFYVQQRWPKFCPVLIKRDAWIDYITIDDEVPSTPCIKWWELNITATGKAALCCMDGTAEYGFGDVNNQSLLEIYNHPTLARWRNAKLNRKEAGLPCARCSY